jgi:phosphopantothenoylcysteine decarboxylase/phosphopantothenate--cysteine ligase
VTATPSLRGVRIVVTAGGTREPIDPVRYLGNRSSGKMGNALAAAAAALGGDVTLITAAETAGASDAVRQVRVDTAAEMRDAVHDALAPGAVLLMAAAVADYRPDRYASEKVKKRAERWDLALVPTDDILATVRDSPQRDALFVVGFAAETDDLLGNAQQKLRAKRLDLIVLNDVSRADIGMGADDNEVTVIDADGIVEVIERAPKSVVAARILDIVAERRGRDVAARP